MEVSINPKYEHLRHYLISLPFNFEDEGCGSIMRNGRNVVKLIDEQFVVKKFVKVTWVNRIIYSFFRKTKARRAYENAVKLRRHEVKTPEEVAYIEIKKYGIMQCCYYIYRYSDCKQLSESIEDNLSFDKDLIDQFAKFVATLHINNIYHNDLNPSNVLYRRNHRTGKIEFQLIDINRIRFTTTNESMNYCLRNLSRIVDANSWSAYFMNRYERYMGIPLHYASKKCEYYSAVRDVQRGFRHLIRDAVLLRF